MQTDLTVWGPATVERPLKGIQNKHVIDSTPEKGGGKQNSSYFRFCLHMSHESNTAHFVLL